MITDPLEIMTEIVKMYDNGELAAEYDKDYNRMVNSARVRKLAEAARAFMPPRLEGDEAAKAMRSLPEDQVNEAIASSGSKVADLRKEFQLKMSRNRGALGLAVRLANAETEEEKNEILTLIQELGNTAK